ncbi:MAG: type II toxin-antitoxin system death-on-curing family toxin [Lamprobacter sp.]|uniref:type II toxin-antitoxin system death-on-curing family toxin n=1 Tax=Lamprobacter sp. TaxID=3100796 RepID=UPI002B260468|nr:type II toxin-antitoxin system death-on-curing family toxin [Lamprobacter sp.]MEA3643601.1 type II toxin-antitoxin system death-on-curing family toxin [Lamprobacter sp.]
MSEPIWLRTDVILAIHRRLLADHGGLTGLRDAGLLDSALGRPKQLLAYGSPDLYALAAAYAVGLVRNHPFVDGNKRIAFMSAYVFLARHGLTLIASEDDAAQAVLRLAAGDMQEAQFAQWLRAHAAEANSVEQKN